MATSASCISIVCCLMSPVAIVIVIVVSVLISACFPSVAAAAFALYATLACVALRQAAKQMNRWPRRARCSLINFRRPRAGRQAGSVTHSLKQSVSQSGSQSVNRAVPQSAGNSSKAAQTNKLSHSRLRLRRLPHLRHLLFLDIDGDRRQSALLIITEHV